MITGAILFAAGFFTNLMICFLVDILSDRYDDE